jgi:hypothetical protein
VTGLGRPRPRGNVGRDDAAGEAQAPVSGVGVRAVHAGAGGGYGTFGDHSKVATATQPTLVMKYPILHASQTLDGTKVEAPNWVNC